MRGENPARLPANGRTQPDQRGRRPADHDAAGRLESDTGCCKRYAIIDDETLRRAVAPSSAAHVDERKRAAKKVIAIR